MATLRQSPGSEASPISGWSKNVAASLAAHGFNAIKARVPAQPVELGELQCCFLLHVIEHMRDAAAAGELVTKFAISCRRTPPLSWLVLIISTGSLTSSIELRAMTQNHEAPSGR